MGTILSYPDLTLGATLSGGSWQSAYPLTMLKNSELKQKARSTNALTTSTIVIADLGATPRAVSCLAILSHNISFAGSIRAQGYSNSACTALVPGADSGIMYAYPQTLTAEMAQQYPDNWIFAFATPKTARYWKFTIVDTGNLNGWIEFGRLWIGEGTLAPATSISYGSSLVYESRDVVVESLGGNMLGVSKTPRRVATVTFETLVGTEKQQALLMQKTLGKLGELLYVMNSAAQPIDMIMESFLATMRTTDPLAYPFFGVTSQPLELVEIINTVNYVYLYGGSPTDVSARQ